MRHAPAIIIAILVTSACIELDDDPRLDLVELDCSADPCVGRWAGTNLWTPVYPIEDLLEQPAFDPVGLWDCEPDPDHDFVFCIEVESGLVGCFRDEDDWGVPVAPTCAVDGFVDWIDVGAGMSAKVETR